MPDWLIRPAGEADLGPVTRLLHQGIDRCYSSWATPLVYRYYLAYHAPHQVRARWQDGVLLVLEEAGHILATASLLGNYATGIMVDQRQQGRGMGGALLDMLIQLARDKGFETLRLDAVPGTEAYYLSRGFISSGERWMQVPGGERLYYFPMVLGGLQDQERREERSG